MTLTAQTTDDSITHEVINDQRYGPPVWCGTPVAWTPDDWLLARGYSRWADRHEDREVDCMACVAGRLKGRMTIMDFTFSGPNT
jgi:hypothetical protein